MINYPVLRPRHLIVHTEERRNDQVSFEGQNRFRLIGHSPVRIHLKAMSMAYPVHTLDVRSGFPVAVCFTFSLRSTMFGSIFKVLWSDCLCGLIPIKSSFENAQALSFGLPLFSDQVLCFLRENLSQNRSAGLIFIRN